MYDKRSSVEGRCPPPYVDDVIKALIGGGSTRVVYNLSSHTSFTAACHGQHRSNVSVIR